MRFETDGISISPVGDEEGSAVRIRVDINGLPTYIKFVDPEKARLLGQAIIEAADMCVNKEFNKQEEILCKSASEN